MNSSEFMFECDFPGCQSTFGTRFNLRRHFEARHLGIKRFACDICGVRLASKQTKEEHRYTHTGEMPYVCPYPGCGKRLRQSSQMSVHMRMHSFAQVFSPLMLPPICEARRRRQRNVKLPLPPALGRVSI